MKLIHICANATRSKNDVHRLNMSVKTKKHSGLLKSNARRQGVRKNSLFEVAGCWPSEPENGGAKRDRTADLLDANQTLSQLSYGPLCERPGAVRQILVGLGRFELPTSPLSGVRSNQLSYRPNICSPSFKPIRQRRPRAAPNNFDCR